MPSISRGPPCATKGFYGIQAALLQSRPRQQILRDPDAHLEMLPNPSPTRLPPSRQRVQSTYLQKSAPESLDRRQRRPTSYPRERRRSQQVAGTLTRPRAHPASFRSARRTSSCKKIIPITFLPPAVGGVVSPPASGEPRSTLPPKHPSSPRNPSAVGSPHHVSEAPSAMRSPATPANFNYTSYFEQKSSPKLPSTSPGAARRLSSGAPALSPPAIEPYDEITCAV